jgi:flagellar basal-body rod protein FlgB
LIGEVVMSDGFEILEGLIRQAVIRNGVVASNIANVDTPNYKAKDVHFGNALDDAFIQLKTTHAQHLKGGNSGGSEDVTIETTEPWADKNNVELDVEVEKMTENALLFQAGVTLFSTKVKLYKNALGR